LTVCNTEDVREKEQEKGAGTMNTIDMNTTEGLYAHLNSLPTANLEAIAARPIWSAESATMAAMAGLIVDLRKKDYEDEYTAYTEGESAAWAVHYGRINPTDAAAIERGWAEQSKSLGQKFAEGYGKAHRMLKERA